MLKITTLAEHCFHVGEKYPERYYIDIGEDGLTTNVAPMPDDGHRPDNGRVLISWDDIIAIAKGRVEQTEPAPIQE